MRIVAYCRVSTEQDEQMDSLDNQKKYFEDFAKIHGHELVKIYADEGVSGKQAKNRTQFLKMLDDAKLNLFEMVVVKDISRFARNTVDFLTAVRQLKQGGIEVQFISNNQTVLGGSEFILTIFSALAQEESASLSKRVKFGKKVNAKKGRVPNLKFGYNKIDSYTLEINADESNIVKKIFTMYDEGVGLRKICNTLNSMGIRTKKNSEWSPLSIHRILQNEIYKGILVNNKSETVDFLTGERRFFTDEEVYKHERPEYKIIEAVLFDRVQQKISERSIKHGSSLRYSNRYVFSGMIKCGECQNTFRRRERTFKNTHIKWFCSGRDRYTSKYCENDIYLDESVLLENIVQYFSSIIDNSDSFIESIITQYKERYKQNISKDDEIQITNQIKSLKKLNNKYKDMYTNDIISMQELKENTIMLRQQIRDLEAQLEYSEINRTKMLNIGDVVGDTLIDMKKILSSDKIEHNDLSQIIEKIIVYKDGDVKIYLKLMEELNQ